MQPRRFWLGSLLLAMIAVAALAAPVLAPHAAGQSFKGLLNAPPTRPHVMAADGSWHRPFIYRWRLISQLEQRYEQDRAARVPLVWLNGGHLGRAMDDASAPLLLLGSDSYGRDVFARILFGARVSLTLAVLSGVGAVLLGAAVGGIAGYAGGTLDDLLMRMSDLVVLLPAMYVALTLRAVLPLVLSPA